MDSSEALQKAHSPHYAFGIPHSRRYSVSQMVLAGHTSLMNPFDIDGISYSSLLLCEHRIVHLNKFFAK